MHTHEQQHHVAQVGRCSLIVDCQTASLSYQTVTGASQAQAAAMLAQLAGYMHTIPDCNA